jgi:hypothetical protein
LKSLNISWGYTHLDVIFSSAKCPELVNITPCWQEENISSLGVDSLKNPVSATVDALFLPGLKSFSAFFDYFYSVMFIVSRQIQVPSCHSCNKKTVI